MDQNDVAKRIAERKPTLFTRALVLAGSFDPPANHHVNLTAKLIGLSRCLHAEDSSVPVEVIVWPIGAYATKQQLAPPKARLEMLRLAMEGLDVTIREDDVVPKDGREFGYTSTHEMQSILSSEANIPLKEEYLVPNHTPVVVCEVWHVLGADNVGAIREWNEGYKLWTRGRFIILARPGYDVTELPPNSYVLTADAHQNGSSTEVRKLIAEGKEWEHLVSPKVAAYIKEHNLYQPTHKGVRYD